MLPDLEPIAAELEENRRRMDRALGRLSEAELDRSRGTGEYSPRETLAHLAGAERGMTRLMQLMAAGEKPRLKPDYNNDYYNARQQEKRAKMSVGQLRAELEEARHDLLAFMETLREADLAKEGEHPTEGQSTVLGVLKTLTSHERDHVLEMDAWTEEQARARK